VTALAESRKAIRLAHTAAEFDDLVALATKRRWNATQLLEHVVEAEQREIRSRSGSGYQTPCP
jgi:hypothetical protein